VPGGGEFTSSVKPLWVKRAPNIAPTSPRFANVVVADGGRVHPRERIEGGANRGPGQESDPG